MRQLTKCPGLLQVKSYHECVDCTKGNRSCRVKRVNARSLHELVYQEIRRAVEHPTRMTEIIREAVKTIEPSKGFDEEIRLTKRRVAANTKETNNIVSAIAVTGKSARPLLDKLKALEDEKSRLEAKLTNIERAALGSKIERPSVEQVCALWSRFANIYRSATDDERSQLMPMIVKEVVLTEKERGTVRLNFTVSRSLVVESVNFGSGGWT